jgi:hypothetical protein
MADSRAKHVMGGKGKAKSSGKKTSGKGKHPIHEMTIRPTSNGGFVVHHTFKRKKSSSASDAMQAAQETPEPEEHALGGMDELHEHLDNHEDQLQGGMPEAGEGGGMPQAAPSVLYARQT